MQRKMKKENKNCKRLHWFYDKLQLHNYLICPYFFSSYFTLLVPVINLRVIRIHSIVTMNLHNESILFSSEQFRYSNAYYKSLTLFFIFFFLLISFLPFIQNEMGLKCFLINFSVDSQNHSRQSSLPIRIICTMDWLAALKRIRLPFLLLQYFHLSCCYCWPIKPNPNCIGRSFAPNLMFALFSLIFSCRKQLNLIVKLYESNVKTILALWSRTETSEH